MYRRNFTSHVARQQEVGEYPGQKQQVALAAAGCCQGDREQDGSPGDYAQGKPRPNRASCRMWYQ